MPVEPPKLHSYASWLYAHMAEESREQIIKGNKYTVWEGFIGKTARELNLPAGTEDRVMKELSSMGCIEILVRGVSQSPTVVVLFKPPTPDLWEQIRSTPSLTRAPTLATMRREQRDILKQLGGVNLKEVLKDFEDRISAIETFLEK